MKDFDMIKAVAAELSEIGLTQNKELSICLAIDYMASTNSCYTSSTDIALPFDYSTRFSRIVNPMWATDMYKTHGQDAKVDHYLQPHFMDGYIKKDDYIYITTGYLQFDKTLLDPYDEDSSDEEDYVRMKSPQHFMSGATSNTASISSSAGSSSNSWTSSL